MTTLLLAPLAALLILQGPASTPANPAASVRARAVLDYLATLPTTGGKHILSGQFTDYGPRAEVALREEALAWAPQREGQPGRHRLCGFTEFGPHGASNPPGDHDDPRLLAGIDEHFPRASFFLAWHGKWALAKNANTKALLDNPEVIDREDLPKSLGLPRRIGSRRKLAMTRRPRSLTLGQMTDAS